MHHGKQCGHDHWIDGGDVWAKLKGICWEYLIQAIQRKTSLIEKLGEMGYDRLCVGPATPAPPNTIKGITNTWITQVFTPVVRNSC